MEDKRAEIFAGQYVPHEQGADPGLENPEPRVLAEIVTSSANPQSKGTVRRRKCLPQGAKVIPITVRIVPDTDEGVGHRLSG